MNSRERLPWRNIKQELEDYAYSCEPGQKLPSEPELSKQFGVSRATIRTAIESLAARGLLQKRHGSGTYVNPEPFLHQESFLRYIRYPVLIEMKGYQATEHGNRFFYDRLEGETAKQLEVQEGEECISIQKGYYADENLAVFCKDTLPLALIPSERQNAFCSALLRRDLRELIFEETGRRTTQNVVHLSAVFSNSVEAISTYLTTQEAVPMILLRGCYFDHNRKPLFFSEAYLDTRYLDLRLNR